jgi:hypothetical protein
MSAVHATFDYVLPLPLYEHEKPFIIFANLPSSMSDQRTTNLAFESKSGVPVQDIRGREAQYSLGKNGFMVERSPTSFSDWTSRGKVENQYFQEVQEIVRKAVGGGTETKIVCFDWRVSGSTRNTT